MRWWPFKRKSKAFVNEPHIKGSRIWIQDLREVCERCFDDRAEGQKAVLEIRIEWQNAHSEGELLGNLSDGLDRRASKLLEANDAEWNTLLNDEDFWKPGWGSTVEEE